MAAPAGAILGYVDRPAGTPRGDSDAARLRGAGVREIHYEADPKARPVWRDTLETCRSCDVVVVVSLDRIGQPLRHLLRSMAALSDRGIGLRCLEGGVNLGANPAGRAQVRLVSALVECLDIWEECRSQRRSATMKERGNRPGAHPKLRGAFLSQVLAMLNRPGATQVSVARELGVGRTTLYRFLNRTRSHS